MTQTLLQVAPQEIPSDELISLEECKKFLGEFNLPDERVLVVRNSVIGLVNTALNVYIENFDSHGC